MALSSTETEYMGQTMAATTVQWVRNLLKELKIDGIVPKEATIIHADNQGAIKLANTTQYHRRSKHIAVRYHYTRNLIENEVVKLDFKPTEEMMADGLTKPLAGTPFRNFIRMLGLREANSTEGSE